MLPGYRAGAVLATAPDGSWLAVGDSHDGAGTVRVVDTRTGALRMELPGHQAGISALAVRHPMEAGSPRGTPPPGRDCLPAPADPEGEAARSGSGTRSTGGVRHVLVGHSGPITTLAVAPDGSWSASGCGPRNGVGEVRIWNPATGELRHVLRGDPGNRCRGWPWRLDGSGRASASADLTGGEVHVWDPVTGRRRATLDRHRHGVRALTVSRDGTILATGDGTDWGAGTVRIFETATFRPELTLDGHTNTIAAIVIAPDGSWIASGDTSMAGRGEVRIWTTDGVGQAHWDEPERAGWGDARAVRALAATTDGQRVLSLGRAARTAIRIWDPATGELDAVVRRDASDFGVFPDREWIALAENRDPDGGAGTCSGSCGPAG